MDWVDMIQERTRGRLLTALRLAFYPAFEPVETKHFQALSMEAENARSSGDVVKAEKLYSMAMAEARTSPDSSHLSHARHGLGRVYQEQRKYREAEHIFRDLLQEAASSHQPNTQVHAGHMSLAEIYQDEGKFAEAEEHYKAAVAETKKTELWPECGFFCSTSMWLAKFYVAQHRYSDAEPLFQRALKIYEADASPDSYLPAHLQDFAKFYEEHGKYEAAEKLYRRALEVCEQSRGAYSPFTVRAFNDLARFSRARGRYSEAEELSRRSLAITEENVRVQSTAWNKFWRRLWNRKEIQARISRSQIPISSALDRLAEAYEDQQKYVEAEPLRRRSLEIKERAWGMSPSFIVDSLSAHANLLNKLGREGEAAAIGERVKAIRMKYPQGSVHCTLRAISRPLKRNLRWRISILVNAIIHPSRFQSNCL